MITTYLFDLDDTIIDSSIYTKMYQPVINALSNRISPIELQKIISKLKKKTKKSRIDTYDLCEEVNMTELYYDFLSKYIEEYAKLKFDIKTVFKKIKNNGKNIGIVSNAKERTINLFIDHFDLRPYVNFIYSGDKSNPDFWQTLIIKKKLEKTNTLLVDNDNKIVELARASGLKALQVKKESIDGFNF